MTTTETVRTTRIKTRKTDATAAWRTPIPDGDGTYDCEESPAIVTTDPAGDTSEGGNITAFTVKLKSPPDGNVSLTVISSDTSEGNAYPAALTFTEDSWNAFQTVMVVGVDDDEMDGNQAFNIQIDVNDIATVDTTGYKDLDRAAVSVTNTDDETVGFTISGISGDTSEDGDSAAFVVRLNSRPEADVTIGVSSDDTTEGTVSPSILIFTPDNWNSVGHIVVATGRDDDIADGDRQFTIVLGAAVSDDDRYNGLDPADVTATNTDNDGEGVTDSDGDGVSDGDEIFYGTDPLAAGDVSGIPVLISPEDAAASVELCPVLSAAHMDAAFAEAHASTRWQIASDDGFTTLLMDITSESALLDLAVPDLVLEGETLYFWRVLFTAADGSSIWSRPRSFTTEADDRDQDGNGLPDDQELSENESIKITVDAEENWEADLAVLSADAEDGTAFQAALRLSDDGSELVFFSHTPAEDLAEACPEELSMGLFSMKLTVPEAGGSTRVRIYFSPSYLAADTVIYKYDPIQGWYDYTGYAEISDDLTYITIELTDGGYGDADGTANGIIVDPFGAGASIGETGDDSGDTSGSSGSGGGGGGGCFIGSVL